MKHPILIILLLVCALATNAQTYTEHLQDSITGKGRVRVFSSEYIDTLVNGKINIDEVAKANKEANKKKEISAENIRVAPTKETSDEDDDFESVEVDTSKKVVKNAYKTTGYRVQVFAGSNSRSDKTKAESIGSDIKRLFPDQPVYVHFYSPRWICRMGNYRTYEEAQEILTRVKAAGFKQANIVKGTITITN